MMPARRSCLGALLVMAAAAAATAPRAWAQHIPGAAARVNGVEISNLRLERHFEEYMRTQRRHLTSMINPRVYKKLKREALDQLIERELLWQAARAQGIVAGDDEVAAALRQMEGQLKSRAAYLRQLEQAGFDERSYAQVVREELSGARYLLARSGDAPVVSDEEVAAWYRANLHRFERGEGARARHILIGVRSTAPAEEQRAARARIEALQAELRAGADFAALARQHSTDRSAAEGGDLGLVTRGATVRPFEEALFALEPGQVSPVVQTPFGYHLIKLESKVSPGMQPLEEARDGIRARLVAERRAMQAREAIAALKAAARIEVLAPLDGG